MEPFPKVLNKFRGIPFKILCFPENLVTLKILLRIRYDSYIGIFGPIGTISEVFEKSSAERSAEDSVIPCFPGSATNCKSNASNIVYLAQMVADGLALHVRKAS